MVRKGVGKKIEKTIVVESLMASSVVWPSVVESKVRLSWKQHQEADTKNGIYANRRKPSG